MSYKPETLAHMAVRLERYRAQRDQCMASVKLLVGEDHKDDCRFQFAPVTECPTCWPSYLREARETIKAIEKRIKQGARS